MLLDMILQCPKCINTTAHLYDDINNNFNSYIKCSYCGFTMGGFSNKDALLKVWERELNK